MNTCLICDQTNPLDYAICHNCQKNLPILSENAHINPIDISVQPCYWDKLYTFYDYRQSIQVLIQQFKFKKNMLAGDVLKQLFYQAFSQSSAVEQKYDVIVPMPIHRLRNIRRGFNQSSILAKFLAKKLAIPIDLNYVKRTKHTKHQNKLSLKERAENIKGAFKVSHIQPYQHVLIIDDVITTGNSANELAKTLKNSGVNQITIMTLSKRSKSIDKLLK